MTKLEMVIQRAKSPFVNRLPDEVLIIIFKFASSKTTSIDLRDSTTEYGQNSFQSKATDDPSSLFYYTLASVCRKWRQVMSRHPPFWSSIIIFLGSDPTSLSDIQDYLQWSCNLLIDVVVTRKENDFKLDTVEPNQAEEVIKLLNLHLHRIQSLTFDIMRSDSLPAFPRSFHGTLYLRKLALKCRTSTCAWPSSLEIPHKSPSETAPEDKLAFPCLESLTLSGSSFIRACRDAPNWMATLSRHGLELKIAGLHNSESKSQKFDLYEAIDNLRRLPPEVTHLTITDVHFNCTPDSSDGERIKLPPYSLTIEDLPDDVVYELLDWVDTSVFEQIHIIRCSIDVLHNVPNVVELTLTDIGKDEDLVAFLSEWGGGNLSLVRCPGFSDEALEMMGEYTASAILGAPNLSRLWIHDCPNFSVGALKKMVETRNEEALLTAGTLEERPVLSMIKVTGRGPFLSGDDADWLLEKVNIFIWRTMQAMGDFCVVSNDVGEAT